MTEKSVYVRKTSGLTRSISSTDALLSNLVGMGIVVNLFWVVFASATYPGADLTATVFTALIVNVLIAYVYWMLATAMPRTGGDYVFVGRLLHPALGFMVNATFVYLMISWPGLFSQLTVAQGFQMVFANLGIVTGNLGYLDLAGRLASDQSLQFGLGSGLVLLVVLIMLLPLLRHQTVLRQMSSTVFCRCSTGQRMILNRIMSLPVLIHRLRLSEINYLKNINLKGQK